MPPVAAMCISDLRLRREVEIVCSKAFDFCVSLSPWVSEKGQAEANIPRPRLQVSLEVALAAREAGEEEVVV